MNGAGIQRARIFHMVANMKVSTLISEYNTDRPNQVDDSRKINWLKKVEAMIIREVVSTHQGGSLDTWTVDGTTLTIGSTIYDTDIEAIISDFGDDTELIVPDPYSDLYMFCFYSSPSCDGDQAGNRGRILYAGFYSSPSCDGDQ